MKKTTIAVIAIIAAVFTGSIANAGNFIGSNVTARGIAIPGLNQAVHLSDQVQCQIDKSNLQGQLQQSQDDADNLEGQVRDLEDRIRKINTPGTCENECVASPDNACITRCTLRNFRG